MDRGDWGGDRTPDQPDKGLSCRAKNTIPPIHSDSDGGWYDRSDVVVTRDQIRGQFKLNGANHPKLMINRQSGLISLDGLTKFKGSRDPIDDRDHRRF